MDIDLNDDQSSSDDEIIVGCRPFRGREEFVVRVCLEPEIEIRGLDKNLNHKVMIMLMKIIVILIFKIGKILRRKVTMI